MSSGSIDRRAFTAAIAAAAMTGPSKAAAPSTLFKAVPSSGERIPAIGMGTWLTFDVGGDRGAMVQRANVLRAFFAGGGRLIDSSPMYGTSQAVIGSALAQIGRPSRLFAADKVWTSGAAAARAQLAETRGRWGVARFDLLQVHNLVDWRTQLKMLRMLKDQGQLRYVGVTSYDGMGYGELEAIMRAEPIDFVQFSYSIADRRAEARLLPLARDRGIAVIVNRPFREGRLIRAAIRRPLHGIAIEAGARSWAQFLLKFIVSHPAVTVAIPATRRVDHMRDNMGALVGAAPDARLRARMAAAFDS